MNNQSNRTTIIIAIIGVIGVIATSFFSYKAGTSQVEIPIRATQTAEARQTPATVNANGSVSIQEMQFSAIPYTFGNDAEAASSVLFVHNGEMGVDYQLKYSVPQTGDVYAGLYFSFDSSENLEAFKFVEVTFAFADEGASFDMFMKDITKPWIVPTVHIGKTIDYPDDVKVTQIGGDYKITIPLSKFAPLDLKAVKEIGFSAGVFSFGKHGFTIKKIEFFYE